MWEPVPLLCTKPVDALSLSPGDEAGALPHPLGDDKGCRRHRANGPSPPTSPLFPLSPLLVLSDRDAGCDHAVHSPRCP